MTTPRILQYAKSLRGGQGETMSAVHWWIIIIIQPWPTSHDQDPPSTPLRQEGNSVGETASPDRCSAVSHVFRLRLYPFHRERLRRTATQRSGRLYRPGRQPVPRHTTVPLFSSRGCPGIEITCRAAPSDNVRLKRKDGHRRLKVQSI